MRSGESLVQVDVHCIDAQVARTHTPDNRVEIGAVAIDITATAMHRVRNSLHVAFEQTAGVWIGYHHTRDVGAQTRF